ADGHVISSGAGQAVNLVDDDVVDRVFLDIPEQPLQLRPVGRAGAFAPVSKLLDDFGTQSFGFPAAGVPLGRDGVALGFTAGFTCGSEAGQVAAWVRHEP